MSEPVWAPSPPPSLSYLPSVKSGVVCEAIGTANAICTLCRQAHPQHRPAYPCKPLNTPPLTHHTERCSQCVSGTFLAQFFWTQTQKFLAFKYSTTHRTASHCRILAAMHSVPDCCRRQCALPSVAVSRCVFPQCSGPLPGGMLLLEGVEASLPRLWRGGCTKSPRTRLGFTEN